MTNHLLAEKLIRLRARDLERRAELVRAGTLFDGYDPGMEAVHIENARALESVVNKHGWPGVSLVGADAAEAAWLVAQHAISCPALQRRFRESLEGAVEAGEAPARQLACLTDRIRFNERRPQVYGTLHDWDETGQLSPWPVENTGQVDRLRREAGLPPLSETTARLRAEADAEGDRPKGHFAERQARMMAWARKVGWTDGDR